MYAVIFATVLSEKIFILKRIKRDIIINVHKSSSKVSDIFGRF